MAGPAATPTLERLDGERATLVAWLAGRFRGRLTREDAEDLVAETLPRLAADAHLPEDPQRAGAYVRRALWRDALDELRHRHGRDLGRREPVALEHAVEQAQPEAEPDGELVDHEEKVEFRAAASRILTRLSRTDAQVLRLKFLDGVSPDAIAAELGVSRSQYQRRLTAASRRALDALVDAHSGPACPHVRRLIAEAPMRLLDRDQAGRRDVHLEECVHCRAFSLRARGALELLPLPAAGMLERLWARLGELFGRTGESVTALKDSPEGLGGGAAGVAGAGAGTALSAGLGAQVVIGCTGAAVAALCAGPLGVVPRTEREPVKRPVKAAAKAARPAAASAKLAVAAQPVATSGPRRRASGQTGGESVVARRPRQPSRRASAAQEFGPESSEPATNAVTAAAAASGAASTPLPEPAPAATVRPSSSSSFSGEFAP